MTTTILTHDRLTNRLAAFDTGVDMRAGTPFPANTTMITAIVGPVLFASCSSEKLVIQQLVSLDDSAFELLHPIWVYVESAGDDDAGFIATFPAAKISASGEDVEDAIEHLKEMLVGSLEHLSAIPSEKLGRLPKEQLSSLRANIRQKPS